MLYGKQGNKVLVGKLGATVAKLFKIRDELSFRNIRGGLWPVLLVFPVSVIMGNLRYFDHSIALAGFATNVQTFFVLGLGWFIAALTPRRFIIPLLRIAAVISAVLLSIQIFMPMGFWQFALYMAFKFCSVLCAAFAFYLFCFVLNNVERLFGMVLIQLCYGFYYTAWNTLPVIYEILNSLGGVVITAFFLVIVFFCRTKRANMPGASMPLEVNTDSSGRGSGVPFVIGLGVVHYMIMCMGNYIEWAKNSISALAFGLGIFLSIAMILIIQLLKGRNALYIWLLFLVLSLLGLGALLYDTPVAIISGSFAYGIGDSLGYIIIYYMCAGAIKQSKSLRMYRLYCLVFFVEYFIISGLFSVYFNYFDAPNKVLAFGVVLVLVSLCFLFMPLIQKRLFEADWTDGLYLRDMEEYSRPLAETEAINAKEHLDLTPREQEIFTMLLSGKAPKEIAHTLKISYDTVLYHQKKLYRKLCIQSRAELFARYSNR
jgi:DNA-binding CsgD family transcriptional regulator